MECGVLIVLANQEFRDEEYNVPAQIFRDNGVTTKVSAAEPGECRGVGGTVVSVDYTFDEINQDEFGAIIFVGGNGVERYFADSGALCLAKGFYEAGKYVCAICWAPVILARAGIITGKRVTAWEGAKADLIKSGAIFTGEMISIDGKIITANGPDAASLFGQKIADLLLGQ